MSKRKASSPGDLEPNKGHLAPPRRKLGRKSKGETKIDPFIFLVKGDKATVRAVRMEQQKAGKLWSLRNSNQLSHTLAV